MSSMVVWMITLTLCLSAIVLSAAAGRPEVHLAMTALVSLVMAIMGLRENRDLRAAGAMRSAIAASTARYMGLIWVWGGVGLLMTYGFILTAWKEWWHFFLAFAVIGVLCLFFAATHGNDAEKGEDDETMLRLGRALVWGQLIGMIITVIGLLIDPNKRFLDTTDPSWAANNIFFFGSIALAAVSANALLADRAAQKMQKA